MSEQGDLLILSFPAAINVFGDFGVSDRVHVFNWDFIVNTKTGDVTRKVENVKQTAGKHTSR